MAQGKLVIGWSRGDITPPRKTLVQGQFHTRISAEVISPLTATALALEVEGEGSVREQAVFLSCDLPSEGFKADLLRELDGRCPDLDLSRLTINGTHTHNAPCTARGWYDEPEDDPEFMNPDEYRLWLAVRGLYNADLVLFWIDFAVVSEGESHTVTRTKVVPYIVGYSKGL